MSVQEEVFNAFFENLERELPESIVVALRNLLESNVSVSKENIFDVIKEGSNNGSETIQD
ncbi:MAG: hypothetical protein PHS80_05590 [Methanothrix sp.]|nr:hypothetical protein [Methanothrix sp.]MDD4447453.1 hypothetical protein [Methanothrix sp.]